MALADDLALEHRRALAAAGNQAIAAHVRIFLAVIRDLARRIAALPRIGALAGVRIRAMVRAALAGLRERLVKDMVERGRVAARRAWKLAIRYFRELDRSITGAVRPLAFERDEWLTAAARGLEVRAPLIERAYSTLVVETTEVVTPVLDQLREDSAGPEVAAAIAAALLAAEKAQEPRIASVGLTETAYVFGAITFAAILAEDSPQDRAYKRLVAKFDKRTGRDSILLHGQTRPVREMFYDPHHGRYYPFPPNRPRDREIVVGWRSSWGVAEVVQTPAGPTARLGSRTSSRHATPPGAARIKAARNLRAGDVLARGRGQVVRVEDRAGQVLVTVASGRQIAYASHEEIRVLPKR